jgi:dUTP pyrophosphatase
MAIKFEKISEEQFIKDIHEFLTNYGWGQPHQYTPKYLSDTYAKLETPKRKTNGSAGYDICSAIDFSMRPSVLASENCRDVIDTYSQHGAVYMTEKASIMIPTGIKIQLEPGMKAALYNRSSNAKKSIMLTNSVGIIDSDYYNNPGNEGHIWMPFINMGNEFMFVAGEAYAQIIIEPYYVTDDDAFSPKSSRIGGFGSTNAQATITADRADRGPKEEELDYEYYN